MKYSIQQLLAPVNKLLQHKSFSGILLFVTALIAILWVNSPWQHTYFYIRDLELSLGLAGLALSEPLHGWINDGLMAVFFFAVGLEIKRELLGGELASPAKAFLPVAAAFGGMIVPALIYFAFNVGRDTLPGWGIPMSTDIAFTLGLLTLLGKRVPLSLKIFLTALAIVDDLGAVLVIAFFYTSNISLENLLAGVVFLGLLYGGNLLGIRSQWYYLLLGIGGLWLAFLLSGIHATIAGILAAFAIPGKVKINEDLFLEKLRLLANEFDKACCHKGNFLTEEQLSLIEKIKEVSRDAETPLQKIEHQLQPFVSFFVLPVFALFNAGVRLEGNIAGQFFSPVSLGVLLGLVVGKFIGVVGTCSLMVRLRLAKLPAQLTWQHIYGAGLLAGIGFTMSMFVAELAFREEVFINEAKIGIFAAFVVSAASGLSVLYFAAKSPVKKKASSLKIS